jgi:hypothetical protein
VSALARHVTMPASSDDSGIRHDDPVSARAMHSVKRLHTSRANRSVRAAVETRRHCSVLFRPRSWLRSGCGCRCGFQSEEVPCRPSILLAANGSSQSCQDMHDAFVQFCLPNDTLHVTSAEYCKLRVTAVGCTLCCHHHFIPAQRLIQYVTILGGLEKLSNRAS